MKRREEIRLENGSKKEEVKEAEEGGECCEANHNWSDSGRWNGAVAGWNMCVWGWRVDYGVNVEVTEEMESIKYQGSYCIILTVQHLTNAFIHTGSKMLGYCECIHYIHILQYESEAPMGIQSELLCY